MEEIKKAESVAEQSLEDARYRAKYMVDNQKKECEEAMTKAVNDQKVQAGKQMEKAREEGAKYAAKVEDETVKERQSIIDEVKAKEQGAIDLVIKEILD